MCRIERGGEKVRIRRRVECLYIRNCVRDSLRFLDIGNFLPRFGVNVISFDCSNIIHFVCAHTLIVGDNYSDGALRDIEGDSGLKITAVLLSRTVAWRVH